MTCAGRLPPGRTRDASEDPGNEMYCIVFSCPTQMSAFVVCYHGSVVGVMTSAVDAAELGKLLTPSSVVKCRLNGLSDVGEALLQTQGPAGSLADLPHVIQELGRQLVPE